MKKINLLILLFYIGLFSCKIDEKSDPCFGASVGQIKDRVILSSNFLNTDSYLIASDASKAKIEQQAIIIDNAGITGTNLSLFDNSGETLMTRYINKGQSNYDIPIQKISSFVICGL